MAYYHLRNQNNPAQNLMLTSSAWRWTLDLAEQSGWNPMGTINLDLLYGLSFGTEENRPNEDCGNGTYTPAITPPANGATPLERGASPLERGTCRLVMLEDALNLMDALEQAFMTYEPRLECAYRDIFRTEWDEWREKSRPGAGILLALADFCRSGSFWIENKT